MKLSYVKGTTSKFVNIFVQDSSKADGSGLTALTNASAGLVCYFARADQGDAAATQLSLGAGTRGTYSSGGFKEKDATNMPGVYELGLSTGMLATGSDWCVVMLKGATNMAPVLLEIQLTNVDFNDSVRAGLTALPNAAAEAAGGLYTRGSGAGQINQPANGNVDINVVKVDGTALDTHDAGSFPADVRTWNGTAPSNLISGRVDASVGAMAADVITAAALSAAAVTEIRSVVSGTSDSGSTTTMVDAARTEGDTDYWKGCYILFTSGTIAGQVRLITGFTPASDTLTFAPATTQAVSTQTYEILSTAAAFVDVKQFDGSATDGNNATLNLKKLNIVNSAGDAIVASSTGSNGRGIFAEGNGGGAGLEVWGGATSNGISCAGGATSGIGLYAQGGPDSAGAEFDAGSGSSAAGLALSGGADGNGLKITTINNHGIQVTAAGSSKHGAIITGGNAGTSDGIKAVAGTGGVDIRGNITGNVTGNVSGSVGSVTQVEGIKKNTAYANFPFVMYDSSGDPASGLSWSAGDVKIAIDDADFVNAANLPVETSLGGYVIDWAAADVNGTTILIRFAPTGGAIKFIEFKTSL